MADHGTPLSARRSLRKPAAASSRATGSSSFSTLHTASLAQPVDPVAGNISYGPVSGAEGKIAPSATSMLAPSTAATASTAALNPYEAYNTAAYESSSTQAQLSPTAIATSSSPVRDTHVPVAPQDPPAASAPSPTPPLSPRSSFLATIDSALVATSLASFDACVAAAAVVEAALAKLEATASVRLVQGTEGSGFRVVPRPENTAGGAALTTLVPGAAAATATSASATAPVSEAAGASAGAGAGESGSSITTQQQPRGYNDVASSQPYSQSYHQHQHQHQQHQQQDLPQSERTQSATPAPPPPPPPPPRTNTRTTVSSSSNSSSSSSRAGGRLLLLLPL